MLAGTNTTEVGLGMSRWEIKGSVFAKLLLVELALIVGLVLIMNILLTLFFQDFFDRSYEQLLWKAIAQVQEITPNSPLQEPSQEQEWKRRIAIIDLSSGVNLAVLQGRSIVTSTNDSISDITSNGAFLSQALTLGEQHKTATLQGFLDPYQSVLVAAIPLKTDPPLEVIVFSAVSNTGELLHQTMIFVWLASLIVLILATPIVYLVSRNFTQPLAEMETVAGMFALGDFSRRLEVRRRDEMGKLAEALNGMAGQLEQIETNRRNFLADVSHELRTPLTSIRGFIQGMLDGNIAPAEQEQYLSRVYREIQRLVRIVSDLLDMARMKEGQMEYQWESLNLWGLCQEAGESMMPLAAEKGLILSMELPAKAAWIRGDYARLIQVLVNLLDNALKYTREGEVELSGRIEDSRALVSVADTGPGIPPREIPYIFERFYRGGSTRGTGLGLAISKLIMDAHQGTVTVFNRPGGGAVFLIAIPLLHASD